MKKLFTLLTLLSFCIRTASWALIASPHDLNNEAAQSIHSARGHFGNDASAGKVCAAVVSKDVPKTLGEVFRLGLPVFDIETVNHEEPTCDYVTSPEGCMGAGITNAVKVPGRLNIYYTDSITPDFSSGEYADDKSGITIRIRGNTSADWPQKPYKIKLQKKANLMLEGDNSIYKDKDWILIRDPHLYTPIGCKINELVGLQWTPRCRYVNVIVNGDYRGLYLLMESVKRNEQARLNVSKSGYIFEHDPYWWNENNEYANSMYAPSYNYTFKYPEWEDMSARQKEYIQNVLTQFENSIAQATYAQHIDVESFAAWVLGHDLLGTSDRGGSNLYFTKYDNTDNSLIRMANMWDFDSVEKQKDAWSNIHLERFYQFFCNRNKEFTRAYVKKWNEIKGKFFTEILDFVDAFAAINEGQAFDKSLKCNNARWGYGYRGLDYEVAHTRDWFVQREKWLTPAIAELDTVDFDKLVLAVDNTVRIQAENYCDGGPGISYYSQNATCGTYRSDNEGITLYVSDEYANSWAVAYMGNDWFKAGENLTREQAIEQWGAWFDYSFTACEDMEIAINVKAGVNWDSYGIISVYGSESQIIGESEITNWVKRYTASAVVEMDGEELKPNQTCHPVNTSLEMDAYTEILKDKSLWSANPAEDNALWLYPNINNMQSWQPYYQKDVYGEPDNYTVRIKKGLHRLRVKSLSSQWFFDEIKIEGRKTSSIESTASVGTFSAYALGTKIHVNAPPKANSAIEVFDVAGRCLYRGSDSVVDVKAGGVYIVCAGGQSMKVLVK